MDTIEELRKTGITKDVDKLVRFLIKDKNGEGVRLTPKQLEIVEDVVYMRVPELVVAAYTGYGKTYVMAIAELLCATFNDGVSIGHISISSKQTGLCYDYILDFISRNPFFTPLLKTNKRDLKDLRKELTKERITIGNSSIAIHTGNLNQKGRNLLGLHFDMVVNDEDAEIPDEIDVEKIGRMLEESPKDRARGVRKMHVRISTTHHRGHFKKAFDDPSIKTIVADDKVGLGEARVTQEFLNKRRKVLGDYKYGIWYQCRFPTQEANKFFTDDDVYLLLRPSGFNDWSRGSIRVLAVDVARYGMDETVLTLTVKAGGVYHCKCLEHYSKKSITHTVGVVRRLNHEYNFDYIVVDDSGVGGGVSDMLLDSELSAKIVMFKAGGKPVNETSDESFKNAASEAYDFFQKMVREGVVRYVENEWIRDELLQIEFEFDAKGRLHIAKKGKFDESSNSPDFCDSVVYSFVPFIRKATGGFAFV